MAVPLITLTTDWGTADFYTGALKGRLYSLVPGCTVVDISHQLDRSNNIQAAFVIRNCFHRFPKDAVHIVAVASTSNVVSKLMAVQYENHKFLGPDDGVFSLMFDEFPADAYHVLDHQGLKVDVKSDFLAASAAYLAQGGDIALMGSRIETHSELSMLLPSVDDFSIRGSVIFVDGMGNLVTNISRALLDDAAKGRTFEILVRKGFGTIEAVEEYYQAVDPGDWVAVFNESGYIELAIRDGSAKQLTGLQYGDMVRIEFK